MVKKSAVSTAEPTSVEASGARHHAPSRSRSKIADVEHLSGEEGEARADGDAPGDEGAEFAHDLGADQRADDADDEAREHDLAGRGRAP